MFRIITPLLTFIMLVTPCYAWKPDTVKLSTHNLCPYGCYAKDGSFNGNAVRVVRYALRQMGVRLDLVVVPWERAQFMASIGEVDGFFAASKSEKRDAEGVMSAVIAEQKWNWYLPINSLMDPENPDFKNRARVTSFIGANMLKWLRKNDYNVAPPPPTTEDLVNMLIFRRFDAALANNLVMDKILERRGLDATFKSYTLKNKPLGVYFTNAFVNTYPDFLEVFNKHVETYRTRERW